MYWKGSTSASPRSRRHSVSLEDDFRRIFCLRLKLTTTGRWSTRQRPFFMTTHQFRIVPFFNSRSHTVYVRHPQLLHFDSRKHTRGDYRGSPPLCVFLSNP